MAMYVGFGCGRQGDAPVLTQILAHHLAHVRIVIDDKKSWNRHLPFSSLHGTSAPWLPLLCNNRKRNLVQCNSV